MRARFTQSFKMQAVEKALNRSDVTSLREVSDSLGVGHSTLHRWIVKARNQEFESISDNGITSVGRMAKEKRPQDWSPEDKLTMVKFVLVGILGQANIQQNHIGVSFQKELHHNPGISCNIYCGE